MRREAVREDGDENDARLRRPAFMMCMNPVSWREASSQREIMTSESLICPRDSRYIYRYMYNVHVCIHVSACVVCTLCGLILTVFTTVVLFEVVTVEQ